HYDPSYDIVLRSLHDALPNSRSCEGCYQASLVFVAKSVPSEFDTLGRLSARIRVTCWLSGARFRVHGGARAFISYDPWSKFTSRSEEHTSELQSRFDIVCRLL